MEALDNKKGKSYTLEDDKGTKALIIRNKTGTFITNSYLSPLEKPTLIFGKASYILQTKSGKIIVSASETKVSVWSVEQNKPIFEQDFKYIYSITLSPNEQFVQILDKIDSNQGKTLIFSLPKMTKVAQYKQNAFSNYYQKQSYPLVRFTTDDQKRFRYNSKTIEVYSSDWKLEKTYASGPLQFFQINKIANKDSYLIAVLFLDKKTSEGHVTLFSSESQQPYYEKHIKKAEQIKIKFNPKNNKFLMELQTYYDPTGKSYYGEYGLYIFNDQNKKINKVQTAKGPLHDFQWDHKGQNFIVISGFMPAESVMFNQHNKQVFQFGKHHRNNIIWGNKGRLLCLAGFGNLNGQMQIWDMQTKTKIGTCKSNSASYCGWSPDDRKLLTSIVTPRLRVDNCYKIFSYTGVELQKVAFDDTELYQTSWLNTQQYKNMQAKGLSPNRKVQIEEKKEEAKFKSFSASLGFESLSLNSFSNQKTKEQPKLVPGQFADDGPKKKKRVRNKKEPNLQATQQ